MDMREQSHWLIGGTALPYYILNLHFF